MTSPTTLSFDRQDRFERIAALGMSSMHPGGLAATETIAAWAGVGPGTRVLDLGCGVGQTACLLAARGAEVVGLDRSAAMVARARERAARLGAPATFVEGDAYALPFDAGGFDIVFAESVTLFLDRARVLPEIARVLAPGGRAADIVMTVREPVPAEILDAFERLEGVRMAPDTEEAWVAAYAAAGLPIGRSEWHATISDGATAAGFLRSNGVGGLLALGRMGLGWLTDPAVRAYVRELGQVWGANKHRFGYGLLLATKP